MRENTYSSGHPWFYVLGGTVLRPKEILACVKERGYEGYKTDEFQKANNKPEPQRSEQLRSIRAKIVNEFWQDLSRYRKLANDLRRYRQRPDHFSSGHQCTDLHVNLSCKYNHLYNDFAHLLKLDALLSEQKDLFDFLGS